jgi:hypothetical protein
MFAAGAPSLVGTFALAGLYLSLGPSLAVFVLQTDSRVVGGLVILALAGTGAVSAALLSRPTQPWCSRELRSC